MTNRMLAGLALLLTKRLGLNDDVLFVVVILARLTGTKKLWLPHATYGWTAGGIVFLINYSSGNYGWRVLFRHRAMAEDSPPTSRRMFSF